MNLGQLLEKVQQYMDDHNLKLARYGDEIIIIDGKTWEPCPLKVDFELEKNAQIDFPIY